MPPTLIGTSPGQGIAGDVIALSGTGLSAVTDVRFGSTRAVFSILSSSLIHAVVPHCPNSAGVVTVTDGVNESSHVFLVLFPGPWIRQPSRDAVAASDNSGPSDYVNAVQTYGAENTTDAGAAVVNQASPITLMTAPILDQAVLGGWRYGTGLNQASVGSPVVARWYDYQQWEGDVGWSISDVEVVDDTSVYADPDYHSTEFDTTHWTDAVTAVRPVLNVTPSLVGASPGDLASSELRISLGGGGGVGIWISRHLLGETFHPCLDEIEAAAGYNARAFSAGPGAVDLGALDPATFTVNSSKLVHGFLGYVDRQQGAAPLVATENAQDYVAWTLDSIVTTIRFTPLPVRHLFTKPRSAPPQRQFPRDDGLGISTRRSWPPPTSKQYGQRRGPAATYQ